MIAALACPACDGPLERSQALHCGGCGATYPLDDGIPVLLDPRTRTDAYKVQQAGHHDDEADPEYEIVRPHGTPLLFGWLLSEKLRRSVAGLEGLLPGGTVLTVCGGSGMDAEYLARAGARVIASDISLGAARRARERARRFDLDIQPVVADIERLPFRDRSVDVVYVHDGLHHLKHPLTGLAEMTRVAAEAVSVNEPAHAALTSLAVRVGMAFEEEEAGNRIGRMDVRAIVERLRTLGFGAIDAHRYGMYHGHQAGRIARLLSRPALAPPAMSAFAAANRLAGPLGNKLTVKAVRLAGSTTGSVPRSSSGGASSPK